MMMTVSDMPLACGLADAWMIAAAATQRRTSTRRDPEPEGNGAAILEGKRVLIVEDEFFVAIQIEDALQSFGCETSGPYTTLEVALQASWQEPFDLAVLDISLNGRTVFPLADALLERGMPFVFLTGYAPSDLPEYYRSLPRLEKPFDPAAIRRMLQQVLSG